MCVYVCVAPCAQAPRILNVSASRMPHNTFESGQMVLDKARWVLPRVGAWAHGAARWHTAFPCLQAIYGAACDHCSAPAMRAVAVAWLRFAHTLLRPLSHSRLTARHWRGLLIAAYMNMHGRLFWELLHCYVGKASFVCGLGPVWRVLCGHLGPEHVCGKAAPLPDPPKRECPAVPGWFVAG